MSLDSITGDEFSRLDAETHEDALLLYEEAIATCTSEAASYRGVAGTHEALGECLDKLTSYLQLRKLHKQRLQELEDEPLPEMVLTLPFATAPAAADATTTTAPLA